MRARWAPWSALLRRARRLAWRSPLRTAWTGLLVVVAVAVAGTVMSTVWGSHVTASSTRWLMGAADALYHGRSPVDVASGVTDMLASELPAGSELAVEQTVDGLVLMPGGSEDGPDGEGAGGVYGSVRMADWGDPLLDGVIRLVDGHMPRRGEVVLAPDLAETLGMEVGDRLRVDASEGSVRVVGIATIGGPGSLTAAMAPGELVSPGATADAPEVGVTVYVGLPTGAAAPSVETFPWTGEEGPEGPLWGPYVLPGDAPYADGSSIGGPRNPMLGATAVMFVLVVAFVGLLVGAASSIGARRRMRANGLLAATGADRGQLAIASAAEAIVVALPATLVGLVVSWLGTDVWVRLRLQGWPGLVDATMSWVWVVPLVVAAVGAAAAGSVVFSRSSRRMGVSALLDSRDRRARRPGAGATPEVAGWILLGVLIWVPVSALAVVVGRGGGSVAVTAIAVLFLVWIAFAPVVMRLGGRYLDRDPVGRVVGRDLRHRRLGSIATVVVVATWVFVAVVGTATDGFGGSDRSDQEETAPEPTAVPDDAGSPEVGSSVVIQAGAGTGPSWAGAQWVFRDSDAASGHGSEPVDLSGPLPEGLAADLARAGLVTSPATVGTWEGPCPACPSGFTPTVLVLDRAEGVGLAPATVELLRSGNAVTPFDMEGVEGSTVAGIPVRVGGVPAGVHAVVLSSSAGGGGERMVLTDPHPVLVGSTSGLRDAQVARIIRISEDAGMSIGFDELRFDKLRAGASTEHVVVLERRFWIVWPSLVVLLVVALAATAAHRREHGDAARVLQVLGARPRSARRLASLTAGALTGTGVVLGLTAALMIVSVVALQRGPGAPAPWSRDATLVLAVSLALPAVVGSAARLIPPRRSLHGPHGPEEPMPA